MWWRFRLSWPSKTIPISTSLRDEPERLPTGAGTRGTSYSNFYFQTWWWKSTRLKSSGLKRVRESTEVFPAGTSSIELFCLFTRKERGGRVDLSQAPKSRLHPLSEGESFDWKIHSRASRRGNAFFDPGPLSHCCLE